MIRAENDHVVQTLSTNRSDDSLGIGILPGRLRRGRDLLDTQCPRLSVKRFPVNRVSVSDQVLRHLIDPARLKELACRPDRRGMLCGMEVQYSPPIVAHDNQHEQRRRRYREEIEVPLASV